LSTAKIWTACVLFCVMLAVITAGMLLAMGVLQWPSENHEYAGTVEVLAMDEGKGAGL